MGMIVGKYSLVALDTDHIKQYVFATDKLKEIRGASSILDRLNRREMEEVARKQGIPVTAIYTNGGARLILVFSYRGPEFKPNAQRMYRDKSKGETARNPLV